MQCPHDGAPLATSQLGPVTLERCPTCRGIFGTRSAIEALVGRPLVSRPAHVAIAGLGHASAACPACGAHLSAHESREAPGRELLVCDECAQLFVDAEAFAALRTKKSEAPARRSYRPDLVEDEDPEQSPPAPPTASGQEAAGRGAPDLLEASVFAPGPAREAAVLTVIALLAWLFVQSRFGEAVSFLARIQFHELGHALVAWSTGRSALPLPFGWTSWSFERSWLLVSMELLFSTLLAVWGVREKKPAAVLVAIAMAAVFLLGLTTSLDASEPWLVAGGFLGEALLPAIALLAFHAPLPERARWDFFRWPLALFAIVALVSVAPADLAIGAGELPLPMGSFVSGREGDGDLERLVNDYGWAEPTLRAAFRGVGLAALLLGLLPHPLVLGLRALRARDR